MPKVTNFGACKTTFLKPRPWTFTWRYGPGRLGHLHTRLLL